MEGRRRPRDLGQPTWSARSGKGPPPSLKAVPRRPDTHRAPSLRPWAQDRGRDCKREGKEERSANAAASAITLGGTVYAGACRGFPARDTIHAPVPSDRTKRSQSFFVLRNAQGSARSSSHVSPYPNYSTPPLQPRPSPLQDSLLYLP